MLGYYSNLFISLISIIVLYQVRRKDLEDAIVFFRFCRECDNFESWMADKVICGLCRDSFPTCNTSPRLTNKKMPIDIEWGCFKFVVLRIYFNVLPLFIFLFLLQEQVMMTKDSLSENMEAVKRKYEVFCCMPFTWSKFCYLTCRCIYMLLFPLHNASSRSSDIRKEVLLYLDGLRKPVQCYHVTPCQSYSVDLQECDCKQKKVSKHVFS